MTKSTTIVFILFFSILFKLEKKVSSKQFYHPSELELKITVMESLRHSVHDHHRPNPLHL